MMKVNILETDTGRILEDELRDWSQAALNQLDKAYGYKSFRPGQLEAVNTILNDRDLIAVMPTGSGKSVCYQLPAMREGHLALVVSPLRALMRDQVQALQARGVAAALIDSGVTPKQRQSIYAMAHGGGLRILYVAPERLFADDFRVRTGNQHARFNVEDQPHELCFAQNILKRFALFPAGKQGFKLALLFFRQLALSFDSQDQRILF